MTTKNITTSIDIEQYNLVVKRREIEKTGWGWNDLLRKGIGAMIQPDVMQERLTALEAQIEAQSKKIKAQRKLLPSEFH